MKGSDNGPVITTTCNRLDFSKVYNYSGIVASGYLPVGRGNSALTFTFYGQKDVKSESQLRNYPTILWLNGGPGSSSQLGNLQEIGPLRLEKTATNVTLNPYTWANKYNLLFIDQPVGTGLSYADSDSAFVKNLKGIFLKIQMQLTTSTGPYMNCTMARAVSVSSTFPFPLLILSSFLDKAMLASTHQSLPRQSSKRSSREDS